MVPTPRVARREIAQVLLVGICVLAAAVATAQSDVTSPSDRFEKGLTYLKDHGAALLVEYVPKEGGNPRKETITAYYEMVQLANKKVETTVLLSRDSGKETKVAQIPGKEMPSKGLGAWLWYKVCAAIDQLDGCREAGVIN